jgi:Asp-tRNA(Asn)/Glu-tRNA(Gln) amidotransferase A subunit family amidase
MSCEAMIRAHLARIDARECEVGAWAYVDGEAALAKARALDASPRRGALHGLAIGVKDVIDTADMPTEYGSPIYTGHRPQRDAACVQRLKAAGAIILGKTVTTEFAFVQPGRTRHPLDPGCTPGGSSSGSAAAVADGMVPVALATQTGGSTIRPAAFCGVVGYKPAFGRVPSKGLKPLAPSLDTIGLIARTVDEVARVGAVLAGEPISSPASFRPPDPPRFALWHTPYAAEAEPQAIARLDAVASRLARAGARVRDLELPGMFADLDSLHRVIMSHETAQSMAHEWRTARDRLSAGMVEFIERGLSTSTQAVAAARAHVEACQRTLRGLLGQDELILTLPAAGEAPVGLASTGNAVFCRLWTLLGVPCLALPAGCGDRGLPLGVQLVGGPESSLFAVANWTAQRLQESRTGEHA